MLVCDGFDPAALELASPTTVSPSGGENDRLNEDEVNTEVKDRNIMNQVVSAWEHLRGLNIESFQGLRWTHSCRSSTCDFKLDLE